MKVSIHNKETNAGFIEDNDGNIWWTVIPPESGELLSAYDKFIKDGGKVEENIIPASEAVKPRSTDMWKAKAVMKYTERGGQVLFDQIMAVIGQLPIKQRVIATQALESAPTFDMDGELVPMLSGALGMSEEEVQALVDEANTIVG